MTAGRLTTVCGTCGNVLWEDEAAGHFCNPRRVAELEQQVADLREQIADLERRLGPALKASSIAQGIIDGRDMITPGVPEPCAVIPFDRAARSSQVTGWLGRTTKRTPGRASCAVSVAPSRRAPAGGVPA